MSEEIFIKIINGLATEAEKSDFYKLLDEDSDKRELYLQYKKLFVASNFQSNKYTHLQNNSFERFWSHVKPLKVYQITDMWYRYAAVFVVAISLGFLTQYLVPAKKTVPVLTQKIEYTSEKGSVSTIHLEDGSEIWLSSASKITLTKCSDGKMSAQLNGEAYFDMIPDPTRKFSVDLGYYKLKDIGTKFNVRAYNSEPEVYTTLIDGQIDLFNCENRSVLSMKPGDYMYFDKLTNRMEATQCDPTIPSAWKDGKFVFIDKTLSEICKELENWYNVQIIIQNKSLATAKYTSVIKRTTTVNLVLKMLSLTDKINYKINDRKEARDIVTIY
jgi:transmembrane sensor